MTTLRWRTISIVLATVSWLLVAGGCPEGLTGFPGLDDDDGFPGGGDDDAGDDDDDDDAGDDDAGDDDAGDDDAGDDDAGDDDAGDDDVGDDDGGDDDGGDDDSGDDDSGDDDSGDDDAGLPYPARDEYHIKGLMPDFWPDYDAIAGANTGGVSMNMTWYTWEPNVSSPPCSGDEQEYGGRCYPIEQATDQAIYEWTQRGVIVTGVLYGVPSWARTGNPSCTPYAPGFEVFCSPDDPDEFARFAGMLAYRYNGLNGHGRIADFVIHNEVNHNVWFDIGCGDGIPCDTNTWIQQYTANYNAAYDLIKAEQSEAKVLVPFTHHFDTDFDLPSEPFPSISVKTFLTQFAAGAGSREWKVAYHPYPKNLFASEFSADDLPWVTFGNIGVIAQWLRATFPGDPHAWEVMLTEQGVNSGAPLADEQTQAALICDAYYNVLGTPGISNFILYRMQDSAYEEGLQFGLVRDDGNAKPAYAVWEMMNRNDLNPPQLSCGFENLPYTVLTRGFDWSYGHWVSSRRLPDGFSEETSGWKLMRDEAPGTELLYECEVSGHNFLSLDVHCDGEQPMGPVGWIWTSQEPGTVALYACSALFGLDHFASTDPACEGWTTDELLGYVLP